jgi:hypothetical protein
LLIRKEFLVSDAGRTGMPGVNTHFSGYSQQHLITLITFLAGNRFVPCI